MRIAISNVTALRSRLEEVASWEVDVAIPVETRLTRQGQRALTGLLRHQAGKCSEWPRFRQKVGGFGMPRRAVWLSSSKWVFRRGGRAQDRVSGPAHAPPPPCRVLDTVAACADGGGVRGSSTPHTGRLRDCGRPGALWPRQGPQPRRPRARARGCLVRTSGGTGNANGACPFGRSASIP